MADPGHFEVSEDRKVAMVENWAQGVAAMMIEAFRCEVDALLREGLPADPEVRK